MRRSFALIAASALLLAGCASQQLKGTVDLGLVIEARQRPCDAGEYLDAQGL